MASERGDPLGPLMYSSHKSERNRCRASEVDADRSAAGHNTLSVSAVVSINGGKHRGSTDLATIALAPATSLPRTRIQPVQYMKENSAAYVRSNHCGVNRGLDPRRV